MENLVADASGNLFATNLEEGELIKINPDTKQHEVYAKIPGKAAGLAIYQETAFLITGWNTKGQATVFYIDKNRQATELLQVPEGIFLNGIIALDKQKFLIADSYAGCIWQLDMQTKQVRLWLKDALLARSTPDAQTPAVNGLKIHKGVLYASNTEKKTLVQIPVNQGKAGTPSLWLDQVNIDDFSFDKVGNIYAATHVYNMAIKISPDKKITIIATEKEGMTGCTSVLLLTQQNKSFAYVSTNGGVYYPPASGIEEGKIVKLFLN